MQCSKRRGGALTQLTLTPSTSHSHLYKAGQQPSSPPAPPLLHCHRLAQSHSASPADDRSAPPHTHSPRPTWVPPPPLAVPRLPSPNANEEKTAVMKRTVLGPWNAIVVADPSPSPVKRRLASSPAPLPRCGVVPTVAAVAMKENLWAPPASECELVPSPSVAERGRSPRAARKPAATVLPPASTNRRSPLPTRGRTGPASSPAVGGARPTYLYLTPRYEEYACLLRPSDTFNQRI